MAADVEDPYVGGPPEHAAVVLVPYDVAWPERYREVADRVRTALGPVALRVEHIGSTSVPGLAAKPVVDVLLVVRDAADEGTYLPALEQAGFVLRVREPAFDEHRMLRTPARDVHLHVFPDGLGRGRAVPAAARAAAGGPGGAGPVRGREAGAGRSATGRPWTTTPSPRAVWWRS